MHPIESSTKGLGTRWYMLSVLMMVTLLSQLDRQLPSLLVGPIRAAFTISDAQFSLMQGYAFAASYTIAGLGCGLLVDRYNRRNLIILGVATWSLMTLLGGFASTYPELLATRVGVGIGEACLAPAAYSMIADRFEPRVQGRALGIYYGSLALGSGLSLFIGGMMLAFLPAIGTVDLFGLVTLQPWQAMFVLAGLPGIVTILLLLSVKEPPRLATFARAVSASDYRLQPFFAHLGRHRSAFIHLFACQGMFAFVGYGMIVWAPTLYTRSFDTPIATAGLTIGAIATVVGFSGTVVSGTMSDRWLAAGKAAARYRVMTFSWIFIVVALPLWPLVESRALSFALFAMINFGAAAGTAAGPASIQAIVPNRMRGKVISLYLLINGLLGMGLGPTAVALSTDYVFGNDAALGKALVLTLLPVAVLATIVSITGRRAYERAHQALQSDTVAA